MSPKLTVGSQVLLQLGSGSFVPGKIDVMVDDEARVRFGEGGFDWRWRQLQDLKLCDTSGKAIADEDFKVCVMMQDGTPKTLSLSLGANVAEVRNKLASDLDVDPIQVMLLKDTKKLALDDPAPLSCSLVLADDLALCRKAKNYKPQELAPFIDHTVLAADADYAKIKKLCAEAKKHEFFSVCVNSSYIRTCKELLDGTNVALCSVVGFPLGAGTTQSKAAETQSAIAAGANEIDMVINIGRAKDHDWTYVTNDIASVVKAAEGVLVKVIFETCLLTNDEIVECCKCAVAAKAHFVKTSTGFSKAGARLDHINLMRKHVLPKMGVKASGGIRTAEAIKDYLALGANRIGASKGVQIVTSKETPGGGGY